jgi:PAS domain S-box-containing protein
MTENTKDLRQRMENAESIVQALRDHEIDAVVGKKDVAILRLRQVEEKLLESERIFRRLADANLVGVGIGDSRGNVTYLNDEMLRMMGRTREEYEKGLIDWNECVAPEYRDELPMWGEKLIRDGILSSYEREFIQPDGTRIPYLGAAALVTPGKDLHVSIALDLTRVQETEKTLRESEHRLRLATTAADLGVFELDISSGQAYWQNDRMYEIFGRTRQQGPLNTNDFYHVILSEEDRAEYDRIFRELTPDNPEFHVVCSIRRFNDSEKRWIESEGCFDFAPDGTPKRLVGVVADITESKEAMEALGRSREDLIRAQAVGQIGSWKLDVKNNVLNWSDESHRIFGVPKGIPLTYESFMERVHPEDREYVDRKWKAGLSGEPYDIEHRLLVDGEVRWVREKAYLEFNKEGKAIAGFGITQDITERKRTEHQLRLLNDFLEQKVAERTAEVQSQADQLRALASQLSKAEQRERKRLAQILHDNIQQHLVAARLQIGSLVRNPDPEKVSSALATVDGIIGEALDLSRSLAVDLSPPVLHQSGLVGALNWLAGRMKERSQFIITLDLDEDAEPDNEEMSLLLFESARELLLNTMKHAGVEQAQVTLKRTDENTILLSVSDNGWGFDPAVVRSRDLDEASFGLFSIQERLTHIGGKLMIESTPGEGTCITLVAPSGRMVATSEESPSKPGQPDAEKTIKMQWKPDVCRVLVVDDHEIMREGLVRLLQSEDDMELVGEAGSGAEAIEMAERLEPDVIVMDVNLGAMSGIEATRAILSQQPHIQVIALSMHNDKDIAVAMYNAGACDYLTKSGPCEDLIESIRSCHG